MTELTHDRTGKFIRTEESAQRIAEALRLRSRGKSYRAIAEVMGVSHAAVHKMVEKGLAETIAEPAEEVRKLELDRLDVLQERMMEILEALHVRIAPNGSIVRMDGQPVPESGPAIQAANTLLRISESRRKLLGLDMPTKVDVSGGVEYRVVGVSMEELR